MAKHRPDRDAEHIDTSDVGQMPESMFAPETPPVLHPIPHPASPNPAAGAVPPAPLKAVAMKKATVTMPGAAAVDVEYPADTPEDARHAAAKKAYMDAVGQWALPAEPHIDLH